MKMNDIKSKNDIELYQNYVLEKMKEDNPISKMFFDKYQEILEKLPEDLKGFASQYLMMFGMMFEEAATDPFFSEQLLLEWKTWERLSSYCYSKAKSQTDENFQMRNFAIDCYSLLEWIKEYYDLDDKEEYEQELKKKEEEEKKRAEVKKKYEELKANKTIPVTKPEIPKSETTPAVKSSKKDINGQLDFFSMLGN